MTSTDRLISIHADNSLPARVVTAINTLIAAGVPVATTVAGGKVRLATTAEATTGTDATIATTPVGVKAAVDAAVTALLNGAPGALDTLKELADALNDDASFAATITTSLGTKVNSSTYTAGLLTKADVSTTAKDLPDATVAGTSGQLAAGVTSNVAAGGAYTSPALDGAVTTPPKRWAIKAAPTAGCTITLPDSTGVSSTVTLLASETLTFRQKTTSGWGVESGNKPLTQLETRFLPPLTTPAGSGLALQWVGDSYGVAPPYNGSGSSGAAEPTRIASMYGMTLTNRSAIQLLATDVASRVIGTVSPMTTNATGVVVLDYGTNDISKVSTAKGRLGIKNATAAIIARAQAASVIVESDASFTYTGTWAVNSASGYGSGSAKRSNVTGDSVSIALPALAAGLNYTLFLLGADSANNTAPTVNITLDGSAFATVNLLDQMATSNVAGTLGSFGSGQVPIVVPGNGSTRTLVVSYASGTGLLYVDDLCIGNANPPQVVVLNTVPWTNANYAAGGGDTSLALINQALLDGIAMANAPVGTVTYVDLTRGWLPAAYTSIDGVHLNDAGRSVRLRQIVPVLSALPARKGMNVI